MRYQMRANRTVRDDHRQCSARANGELHAINTMALRGRTV